MRTQVGVILVALLGTANVAEGQIVRLRLEGIALTYQEVRDGRISTGSGGGAGIELALKRFRLDIRAYTAKVEGEAGSTFDLVQADVRAGFFVNQFLAIEVGGGRRYIDPEFATQEVGVIRVGVLSDNRLNRFANVWVRGAYLVDSRFSGGGDSDLAFELGLGAGLGSANGRFRAHAEYEFQRIDRRVGTGDVPIQMSVARLGVALGF